MEEIAIQLGRVADALGTIGGVMTWYLVGKIVSKLFIG